MPVMPPQERESEFHCINVSKR